MIPILYVILGFLVVSVEISRLIRNKTFDALSFFNLYYFIFFSFVPLNIIFLGSDVVRQKYLYYKSGFGDECTALSIIITYLLFIFGFWVVGDWPKFKSSKHDIFSEENLKIISYVIFGFGFITIMIHALQIGGLYEVISKAKALRSGELVIHSNFLFFRHFNQFLSDAFVLFSLVIIVKKSRKQKVFFSELLFLIISFSFFLYYGLSTMGRRSFVYPILVSYLVCMSLRLIKAKHTFIAISLMAFIIGLGTLIGSFDRYVNIWELAVVGYDVAIQGLGDSFMHFVGSERADLWQFGFLTDIFNIPKDFFPSKLFNFERTRHMYGQTSEFFLGHQLKEGMSGEEVLGLHGYLLVNFGYIGLFLSFFLLGIFYKALHMRFNPKNIGNPVEWLFYWWIIFAFFVYFRDGVLIFVIKQHLTWWVTMIMLVVMARLRKPKELLS